MRPGERVNMIKECATLLAARDWGELDLILREHGLPWTDSWDAGPSSSNPGYDYVLEMLGGRAENDNKLLELHRFLTDDTVGVVGPQPWAAGRFKLFVSHLATHGVFAGTMSYVLSRYGIHGFVAHQSIEPSAEWQNVIEVALATCDAMVVLLHTGFRDSLWCDQEIGYALARRVPILPIAIDLMPYGFLGKVQACKAADKTGPQIAADVVQWLATRSSAQAALTEALVTALEGSGSYDQTRSVFTLLQKMPSLTPQQMEWLERISGHNNQVGDANLAGVMLPDLIRQLVVERGGGPQVLQDPWATEAPF